MSDLPLLGSAIPAMLESRGIEVVFGIPGVHTIELYRGLADSGLRHITPRHEQGAGFMADGYARATGKIAACFIISGPGFLNIATAMAQAMADSVPMLVITTLNPRATLGRGEGRLHELRGQSQVAREVSALSLTVMTADQLAPALDEAFAFFATARPGPVTIEIPIDLLSEPYDPPMTVGAPLGRAAPSQAAVVEAAAILNRAKAPLVIVGGGAVAGAGEVRALIEALGAPTLLTINARGLLPPGHALLAGGYLPSPPMRRFIAEADAVLILGSEIGETDFEYYGEGPVAFSGAVIRVDIDPRQLNRNATPTLPILGDAAHFAAALTPLLGKARPDGAARAQAAKAAGWSSVEPRLSRHRPLLEAIWRVLPDAVVTGDSTGMTYAADYYAEVPAPRRFMSAATGFGTLGYALPAAIGAKAGRPENAVVCLVGDGGFLYTLPELAAAAEADLPVIVLLWNDRSYGEIENYMIRAQVRPVGVSLFPVAFSQAVQGFGANHIAAANLAEVEAALMAARHARCVTVIELDASRLKV